MQIKQDIQAAIHRAIDEVHSTIDPVSDERFFGPLDQGKWSVAETLQHLFLVIRGLNKVLPGPREVFTQWGQAERPSKSFDEIQKAYLAVSTTPRKAPDQVAPRAADLEADRQTITDRFTMAHQALAANLEGWSEEELDTYQIPHLVLGKMTVREILFFTILHLYHHLKPTQERLSKVVS
ncbi:hypothetical protein GCM10023189_49380 [Nibrella saemangeumensis]|uniref:DinB-like domain-containing protein n=1 Tax=Nibrella saemangeumensis TaxID=1084526 RepID=A0ABP8NK38_9BACT